MTYLQELVEQQPIAERYPPHAWAVDSEPWSGREHRLGRLFADTRELAGMLRGWRATAPTHPDAERCRAMFLHFAARVKALLASWDPKGRPAN